jgi:hypothetical protein
MSGKKPAKTWVHLTEMVESIASQQMTFAFDLRCRARLHSWMSIRWPTEPKFVRMRSLAENRHLIDDPVLDRG